MILKAMTSNCMRDGHAHSLSTISSTKFHRFQQHSVKPICSLRNLNKSLSSLPRKTFTENRKSNAVGHSFTGMKNKTKIFASLSTNEVSEPQNSSVQVMDDGIVCCLSANNEVSVFAIIGTNLVKEAQKRHKLAPTATAALGRLLMGTLLLGSLKNGEETIQVTINGRGPIGQLTAVTEKKNIVKGFVSNPSCDPPINDKGKLDVGSAVGSGIISVIRSRETWKEPYTGTIPLVSGEIAEDITRYLAESEQISSAVNLGVSISRNGEVRSAGGFLLQVLPFCPDDVLMKLEKNILNLPPMSELCLNFNAEQIIEKVLDGVGVGAISTTEKPEFGPCEVDVLKPRMLKAIESLGKNDIDSLIEEYGHVEIKCEFCSEVVRFSESEIVSSLQK